MNTLSNIQKKHQFFSFSRLSEYDNNPVLNIYLMNSIDIHNYRKLDIINICHEFNVKAEPLYISEDKSVYGYILLFSSSDIDKKIKNIIENKIHNRTIFS